SRYEFSVLEHRGIEDLIELHTTHAILSALKTPLGHKYLVLGVQSETRNPYLALVPTLASVLKVSAKSAISCRFPGLSNEELLTATAAQLVAMAVVGPLFNGQTLVAHNVATKIAGAIATQAAAKDVRVVYTTDSTDEDIPDSWVRLPQYLSRPDLNEILLT